MAKFFGYINRTIEVPRWEYYALQVVLWTTFIETIIGWFNG